MNLISNIWIYIAYLFGGLCVLGGVWCTLAGIWFAFKTIYAAIDISVKNRKKKKYFDGVDDYLNELRKKRQ